MKVYAFFFVIGTSKALSKKSCILNFQGLNYWDSTVFMYSDINSCWIETMYQHLGCMKSNIHIAWMFLHHPFYHFHYSSIFILFSSKLYGYIFKGNNLVLNRMYLSPSKWEPALTGKNISIEVGYLFSKDFFHKAEKLLSVCKLSHPLKKFI